VTLLIVDIFFSAFQVCSIRSFSIVPILPSLSRHFPFSSIHSDQFLFFPIILQLFAPLFVLWIFLSTQILPFTSLPRPELPSPLMNRPNLCYFIILSASEQTIDDWQTLRFPPIGNEFFTLLILPRSIK
jgi:hypothetical protein